MTTIDRQRRHDERWQSEVLDGLARMHSVLHDISDGIRELRQAIERERTVETSTKVEGPLLLSVDAARKLRGFAGRKVRGCCRVGSLGLGLVGAGSDAGEGVDASVA